MWRSSIFLLLSIASLSVANLNTLTNHDLGFTPQLWPGSLENSSLELGCGYCEGFYFNEPPPDDILNLPSPPMHPNLIDSLSESILLSAKDSNEHCNLCNVFNSDELGDYESLSSGTEGMMIISLLAVLGILIMVMMFLINNGKTNILKTLNCSKLLRPSQSPNTDHRAKKNGTLNASISNSGLHISDQCFLQAGNDKNLTSPIISDHVGHKKTAIPSKCWAQPASTIGRTITRIPNEYEVPSSRTNSTGTSSAAYADMNNESNQRFFSPYNLHTYAEVREVLDPQENYHTNSNSCAMAPESNYDNTAYTHGSYIMCPPANLIQAPNGIVQMSDFNSMRPIQNLPYGQHNALSHQISQPKIHSGSNPIYEHPPQRAQVIITSSNQGVNPTLVNHKGRIHNVI